MAGQEKEQIQRRADHRLPGQAEAGATVKDLCRIDGFSDARSTSGRAKYGVTDVPDARSRDILRARWLDEENKATLQELADKYGVSAERIRQLEANALKKLRNVLAA